MSAAQLEHTQQDIAVRLPYLKSTGMVDIETPYGHIELMPGECANVIDAIEQALKKRLEWLTAQVQDAAPTAGQTAAQAEKQFATVQAAFALKGHQLIRGSDLPEGERDYLVNCWGWTRYFKTWPEVLAFLEQIGGRA